jgi:hypothetical protein
MRNDHDVNTVDTIAGRISRLATMSITPAWWRRTTNRWVAAGILGLLVLAPAADALSGGPASTTDVTAASAVDPATTAQPMAERTAEAAAARSAPRAAAPKDAKPAPTAPAKPPAANPPAAKPPAAKPAPKAPAKRAAAAKPKPVAGLSQAQMDNAAIVVRAGQKAGLPKRAYVIAVATAMQESQLLNLANPTVPQSLRGKSQGVGFDHDSVGLFQQRPSAGWGSPSQLLTQDYAATKFYEGLRQVPGWSSLPLTAAAQAVQVSAFPDAYAKHEARAAQIVNALTR